MEKREICKPFVVSEQTPFPESPECPEGMITVRWQDVETPMVDIISDVVYQELSGEQQHIHILCPKIYALPGTPPRKFPVIVHIPGSAWHRQFMWMGLQRGIAAVAKGYAFVMVEYRPSDFAAFPSQIEDVKSAIRFLRKNADKYSLDADNIGVWGDSSGGHTSAFVGITGDGYPNDGPYQEQSSAVKCAVDWFGLTDLTEMYYYPTAVGHSGPESAEGLFLGHKDPLDYPEEAQKANPINYLSADVETPPFLIMHGGSDPIVPFNQSVLLYNRMRELNKEVTFYKLEGAGHGTEGFNSPEATATVLEFFDKYLK